MIVVSDTTPLRYIVEIDKTDILETIFGRVIIPEKVADFTAVRSRSALSV
jgi:predicted nucleic acid-binding protein